jgi:hypothetical protein
MTEEDGTPRTLSNRGVYIFVALLLLPYACVGAAAAAPLSLQIFTGAHLIEFLASVTAALAAKAARAWWLRRERRRRE